MDPETKLQSTRLGDPEVLRTLQGLDSIAVVGYRQDGTVFFWNRGCENLLGLPASEALGQPLWGFPDDPSLSGTMTSLTNRTGHEVPVILQHQVGQQHDQNGPDQFFLATPLTTPPAANDSMLQAQKLESLGVLAGGIAHDFNNLLLGVVGNADLVLMELPRDHQARDAVEQIAQAGLRAADLCRQLLAFSGKGKVLVEPLNLSRLIQDLAPLMHMSLGGSRLRLDLDPGLPVVEGDATQLRQVVMNLVTNATEAQSDHPGVITIRTRVHDAVREPLMDGISGQVLPVGSYIVVEVADSGVGMSPTQQNRIFEPFFTTKFMGRGLGLAAVQGIIRAHHGTVTVETAPEEGSTFAIYLPARGVRSSVAMPQPSASPAPQDSGEPGHHILVVDDEDHVREVAGHLLTSAGYEVTRVEDGAEAVEVVGNDPSTLALVLLDMTMPGLDGLEVLERIRNIRKDLPVLLSSGYDREKVGDILAEDPACSFIQKPYRRKELLDSAAAMLNRQKPD